jgi:hypothetical protein
VSDARFSMSAVLACALATALLVGAGFVDGLAKRGRSSDRVDELLYYPSGTMVREASLGYETAAADIAWLRAIQYYGEHRMTDNRFDRIRHVMEIVSTLDPAFQQPYVFGGFVLAQEMHDPESGLALLTRGLQANPDSWDLAFEIGFLHYVCRHDYPAASSYFTLASRMPGHPEYVERFAAFANQRAGNDQLAILLWKRVLATGNTYMQEVARREIAKLSGGAGS